MKRGMMFFVCVLFCVVSISYADDYYWDDVTGGELGDSTKWNPAGTPGPDDYVYFTLPDSYTVWLDDYYTHDRLIVEGSDLTLDLNWYEYILDTTNDYNQSIIIGDYSPSALTLYEGSVVCRDLFTGRNDFNAVGTLNLSGSGTVLSGFLNSGWHGFYFGTSGHSVVSIIEDAFMEHGHGQSGIYGKAEFFIDGENTEWYVDGYFGMSAYGTTHVTVSNGGRARFGHLEMSTYPHSSAVIDLTGVGHQTELSIENGWDPISLIIGKAGTGIINLTGSKLYHNGNTAIAEYAGSRGELNINDGSWADCRGSIGVGGAPDAAGGQGLIFLNDDNAYNGNYVDLSCAPQEGQSMVVWPEGMVKINGGRITMEYDTNLANPIVLKGGLLEGWGWIFAQIENESGIVSLGRTGDWNLLDLKYNYIQGSKGTLKVGVSGSNGYWDYGGLAATEPAYGEVTLDGMLDVDLLAGYVPNYNDIFLIVQGQSVSGRFINAPSQVMFEGGRFDVIYSGTEVSLTHFTAEPKCPEYPVADFNRDCLVNLTDFATLAERWLDCDLEPGSYCP